MRNNDIRMMVKEALDNLWSRIKALNSAMDARVSTLEGGGGGGGGGGGVTGVKGNAESSYRTGNVNLTAANIGAKALQSPVSDPSVSGFSVSEFIASISQDAQGVITATKKSVSPASIGATKFVDLSLKTTQQAVYNELDSKLNAGEGLNTVACFYMGNDATQILSGNRLTGIIIGLVWRSNLTKFYFYAFGTAHVYSWNCTVTSSATSEVSMLAYTGSSVPDPE